MSSPAVERSRARRIEAYRKRLQEAAPALLEALEAIADGAVDEEPQYEDWGGDTERAEIWAGDHEHYRCAQIARAAIALVDGEEDPE